MTQSNPNKGRTVRNLLIFVVIVLGAGWLGWGLDRLLGNPPEQQLGLLLWIVAPLLTALALRFFGGDGWADFGLRPALRQNGVWYIVCLLIDPLAAAFVVGLGAGLGFVSFPDASANGIGLFLQAFAAGLIPMFVKNIFEEFAWRGYLAPKVASLGINDFGGHVLVGLVWGAWHIPYYLVLLDRTTVQSYSSLPVEIFVLLGLIGVIPLAVVYGEIRLLTNSVWPPLLLHTMGNAFVNPLIVDGLVKIVPGMDWLVSPAPLSLLSMAFFTLLGISLHRWRLRNTTPAPQRLESQLTSGEVL